MKRLLVSLPVLILVVVGFAWARAAGHIDPFNGTWKINLDKTIQFNWRKPKYRGHHADP